MSEDKVNGSPVFRLNLKDAVVTVRFSDTETDDVKGRIRDILTESYEERLQRSIQGCAQPV
ncbi:MAG: hypothetical protein NC305_14890 [Lachnospiraceae bacterium]|nr:hypothetical protein [Acetatifactor muris]MCM1411815.1 hypothetical protein [Lachnospiraceae bacterium]